MKYFLIIIIFLQFISIILSAVLHRGVLTDTKNPGKCAIRGQFFEPGLYKNPSPTSCYLLNCYEGGYFELEDCDKPNRPTNCKYNGYIDASLPFPQCCPEKWECTDNLAIVMESVSKFNLFTWLLY